MRHEEDNVLVTFALRYLEKW